MSSAEKRPSKGRRSSLLLKKACPLLKFDENEKGYLVPQGIEKIKSIPPGGIVHPVIFLGDGRGGKSYMASRLAGDEDSFVSSDTAEPVTEGIDIVVRPVAPLLKECGLPASDKDEYLLILDCEGGNNAMAAIRTLVNVFGIVIGTQCIFLCSGMASEAALQMLSASLAAVSLIKLDPGSKLNNRRLHFVVNKNTLKYKDDDLEKMLNLKEGGAERVEVRESILNGFADREFHCVPMMGMPTFEEKVIAMRKSVLTNRTPFVMDGISVNGPALIGLLELVTAEIRKSDEVSFPSMHRFVIVDGFLTPLCDRLTADFKEKMPELTDYEAKLDSKNPKDAIMKEFADAVSHIGQKALIEESKVKLVDNIDSLWGNVVKINDAFGDQVLGDVETEMREIVAQSNKGPIGGRGLLRSVEVTMQKMKNESRAIIRKKRGGSPERGPWQDTGTLTTRIQESAFETYGTLPVIRGFLGKKSPNILRKLVAGKQERDCVLKDGHFLWWSEKTAKGEASGCVNFLVNKAKVCVDPDVPSCFIIKPADASGWTDLSSFSGGAQRLIEFDAADCKISVDAWIAAIEQHIKFGTLAMEQLGKDKIAAQVGSEKPTLAQLDCPA